MWEFNVLVTMAQDGRYRQMLEELAPHGEFHKTDFHGVVIGRVPDMRQFWRRYASDASKGSLPFRT